MSAPGGSGAAAGQSGHPADRHYDDQLTLYLSRQLHPVYWSDAAIAANTPDTLTLLPVLQTRLSDR